MSDDNEVLDALSEKDSISCFSDALGSMEGLEFSAAAFWKQQGKTGTHGKRLHQALLQAQTITSLLLKEYYANGGEQ